MADLAPQRQRRILEALARQGQVNSRQLAAEFGVALMTIWRDLKLLEDCGQLRRVRGGAVDLAHPAEPAFIDKAVLAPEEKSRIAAHVARHLLREGDILTLDGGTTIAALVAQRLPKQLTILTNSLPIAEALRGHPDRPTVYLSGGLLRPESGTLVGREVLTFFSRRRATRLLMSATGLDAEAGVTDPNPQEIEVKQAMVASAKEVILLADRSKFGLVSLMQTVPWRRIDRLVTTGEKDSPILRRIADSGVRLDFA